MEAHVTTAALEPRWRHRAHAAARDVEPVAPEVEPAAAQAWCNFVLWTPEALPDDCELRVGTLRREGPPGRAEGDIEHRGPWAGNNLASYRFEVVGDGRRLRVKEFLYDWAFPALDHPCLWKSETHAVAIDGRHVAWFGIDYMGKQAASARLGRTTVEVSVLEGEFSEEELVAFYGGCRAADPVAAEAIARTPLADLSYWARHEDAVQLIVPIGLWEFRRGAHDSRWESGRAAHELADAWGLPPCLGGLAVDSAARFEDARGHEEVEVVYAVGVDRDDELRLIVQRPGGGNLKVPAAEEPHPGHRSGVSIGGKEVQLGWIDERYGPFHAVFATADGTLEGTLLSTTGVGLDRGWFTACLTTLLAGRQQG